MERHRVVAAILRSGEEILLCHRSSNRRWYPSVWDFPGGHVELGEHPHEALRRELLEELGVDVGIVADDPVFHVRRPGTGLDLTVWSITCWDRHPENCQPEEHDAIAWFSKEQLTETRLADEAYLPMLQKMLAATTL